jgi:pimeloyl-ACP methyl ester carboxylesterase
MGLTSPQAEACDSLLRRPGVLTIDGVGHLPNLEAELEFNDALGAFLLCHSPA